MSDIDEDIASWGGDDDDGAFGDTDAYGSANIHPESIPHFPCSCFAAPAGR